MKPIEVIHVPHMELCSVNLILPIGMNHDPSHQIGITHIIEHLIFQAHPLYTQEELMIKIEEMGGIFNAVTDREMTVVYGRIQRRYVKQVISLFKEAIMNLPNSLAHLETEREIILREVSNVSLKPYYRMSEVQRKKLLDSKPYQQNQFVSHDLLSITETDLQNFMEYYQWKYWKLLLVGNLNESDIEIEIKGIAPPLHTPPLRHLTKSESYENEGIDSGLTISLQFPEYLSDLESIMFSNIFFKGIASPLYSRVIKEKGIAYNIENSVNRYQNRKYLEFGWRCQNRDVQRSKDIVMELFENIAQGIIPIEPFVKSGIAKTKTEILIIQENFLRYSHHVTKQIALDTYSKGRLDKELESSIKGVEDFTKVLFEQPKLIGFHIKKI